MEDFVVTNFRCDEQTKLKHTDSVLRNWRSSIAFRSCSLAARGLFMEMAYIMHESSYYGYLYLGAMPLSERALARVVGESEDFVYQLIEELCAVGVINLDQHGAIYSSEMAVLHRKPRWLKKIGLISSGNGEKRSG